MTRPRRQQPEGAPRPKRTPKEERDRWTLQKDKLLYALGTAVTVATFTWVEILRNPLHYEWLMFAAALFGLGAMQGLDKRNRGD